MNRVARSLVLGACLALAGPSRGGAEPLPVAVSIAPQAWLVQRIGGDRVEVITAVAPGESPHAFDPTPRHVARLTEARIFFAVGVPAENHLLPRLAAGRSDLVVVDTAAGISRLPESGGGDDHDHGHGHALDPHVWLAPRLVMTQARHVAAALCEHDPTGADDYRAACDDVLTHLAHLDTELAEILAPVRGRTFFVLHPAFGYFAAAYGLRQSSLASETGDPSPRQLAAALDRVRKTGARAVFTQPQVSLATSRAMAREAGVELVVLDPLAADWDANLRHMARTLREALDDR